MSTENWQDEAIKKSGAVVPDWELEPIEEQKVAQETVQNPSEYKPSVAEARIAELAAESKIVTPENVEQKASDIEAVQERIAKLVESGEVSVAKVEQNNAETKEVSGNEGELKVYKDKIVGGFTMIVSGGVIGVVSSVALSSLALSPSLTTSVNGAVLAGNGAVLAGVAILLVGLYGVLTAKVRKVSEKHNG